MMTPRTPPTEPGWYWFYGDMITGKDRKEFRRLCPVEVHNFWGELRYETFDHGLDNPFKKVEECIGQWQPIPAPVWTEE